MRSALVLAIFAHLSFASDELVAAKYICTSSVGVPSYNDVVRLPRLDALETLRSKYGREAKHHGDGVRRWTVGIDTEITYTMDFDGGEDTIEYVSIQHAIRDVQAERKRVAHEKEERIEKANHAPERNEL